RARGGRAVAVLLHVALPSGRAAEHPRRLHAVRRTLGARPVTLLLDVADVGGVATDAARGKPIVRAEDAAPVAARRHVAYTGRRPALRPRIAGDVMADPKRRVA